MSLEPIPESLSIPLPALVGLCVEHWRLARSLASRPATRAGEPPHGASPGGDAAARHALRRIEDFLKLCELEARNLDGHPFDPGLAVRVVDTIDDSRLAEGKAVIDETLSPVVLWRGAVAKPADVVTRKGTGKEL